MLKQFLVLFLLVATVFAQTAYFKMTISGTDSFIFQLNNPERINEARAILNGGENRIVVGRIIKRQAPYNPQWSFYLDPETISFVSNAIEVCDAGTYYVEDHLDEVCGAFLPGCVWCPWQSRIIAEVTY